MAEAVAGWLVCPVIRIVVDKAKSCAADRIRWLNGGVPDALQQLDGALTELRAVAGAVERSRGARGGGGGGDLDRWLLQLKDAVYEADEVVDEFEYRSLGPPRSPLVKIGKQLVGTDESLNRLKGVIKKLDDIKDSSVRLMQAAGLEASWSGELSGHPPTWDGPDTCSLLGDNEVLGRDAERKDMVSWLTTASPPHRADPRAAAIPVAAIIGLGGMGKTALARVLLHDDSVKATFDLVMWVCPAAAYHKVGLVKQILQSAGVGFPDGMNNFDWLQRQLKDAVSSKRFLLVLDNVWNKGGMDEDKWSEVLAPLRCGKPGSKIMVTTRKKIVATLLNARKKVTLDGLAFDDIWSLFTRIAFSNDSADKDSVLQAIGQRLVHKLKGLPLAAKVVGGMLKGSRSSSYWNKISEMESYANVTATLGLCYRNLQEHLQPCFAICSIFPKNWRFKRDKLVKIWMALDFIRPAEGKKLEDVGKEYFDQLVEGSFFHERKEGHHQNYYYIHDLMHDLAESVSRVECARVESVEEKQIPRTVRHLSVTVDAVTRLKGRCELKRLRTFIILKHSSSSLSQLPDDILKELKGVRVLGLDGCDMVDLSDKIGQLMHLRYLALCKTITRLPQSVTKLFLLQTLSIPKRSHLEKFPEDMRNLKYLRHLDMDRASTSKVAGIGELTRLQGSIEFHVKREKGHTLEDLSDMNGLCRKLHIKNLDVVSSKQEASKAGLRKKQGIKVLELEWNSTGKSVPFVDAQVLEGLEPHPHVEEVRIRRYHGDTSPCWLDMSLKEGNTLCLLKSLYLTNCRKWELLPPLGQLPCLKVLHLKEMCSLRKIGSEFYGTKLIAFPCLVDLEFDDMPQWVEWTKEESVTNVFPRLRKLNLLNCPKLVKVPPFSQSIRKVTVRNTGFVSHMKLTFSSSSRACSVALETCSTTILTIGLLHPLQVEAVAVLTLRRCQGVNFEDLQALTSLKKLHISHLDITDEQLGTCLRGLRSLTSLEIDNCSNITFLPHVESSSGLTTLHIRQCSKLSSLHSLRSFAALESMSIDNCSKLTLESFPANFSSLSSLRKLNIMCCTGLESLPRGFPSSLQVLDLIGCKPVLLNQLQLKDGPEWDKITHIPIKRIH
ncbi:putative disease resistance protein RGA1 [Hordeum vulgare]|uniref:NB-ARC domain-containing protein n=1 Tax=Hordeum vulgare subsp. vulgare TaxID=112509 RepID=A0A287FZF2_HORVV|nr:putative disease resistance protein RGA4 [Hordeum vulgare subsp. vulgare]KAE8820078.1 putative disease resistance protein RGA1 [Hordeum vulgare]